jgi:glycosyltransferase involved in cell wall biosynthesis
VFRDIRTHAPRFDIVVVDDGSTDATGSVAAGAGAWVLRLPVNLGIGGAVQTGFLYALSRGTTMRCKSTPTANTVPKKSRS